MRDITCVHSVHRALNNTESVVVGVCFAFLMYSYDSRELHDLDLIQHYSARGRAVHILDVALVVHGMHYLYDFGHTLITEQNIFVLGPLCRDTQISPKKSFSPCLSLSCCMGIRTRRVTWRTKGIGAHSREVALVWRKYHSLCIMRNFEDSYLTEIWILVRRVLHTGTEITLKMSHLGCFLFFFCNWYMVN